MTRVRELPEAPNEPLGDEVGWCMVCEEPVIGEQDPDLHEACAGD